MPSTRLSYSRLFKKSSRVIRKAVEDYKKGKTNAVMFLVGASMRKLKGRASAENVKGLIVPYPTQCNSSSILRNGRRVMVKSSLSRYPPTERVHKKSMPGEKKEV